MTSFTRENFEPCLKQTFTINLPETEIPAALVEVKSLGQPFKEGAREPFSLLFEADSALGLLAQGTYALTHDALGENNMFLVPVGKDGDRYQYQAVFN